MTHRLFWAIVSVLYTISSYFEKSKATPNYRRQLLELFRSSNDADMYPLITSPSPELLEKHQDRLLKWQQFTLAASRRIEADPLRLSGDLEAIVYYDAAFEIQSRSNNDNIDHVLGAANKVFTSLVESVELSDVPTQEEVQLTADFVFACLTESRAMPAVSKFVELALTN